MKSWFNARVLAGLPGLPGSSEAVLMKAKREGWKWRKHKGRGGGKDFHYSSLPDETRAHLASVSLESKIAQDLQPRRPRQTSQLSVTDLNHALRELERIQERQEALLAEGKRLIGSILASVKASERSRNDA